MLDAGIATDWTYYGYAGGGIPATLPSAFGLSGATPIKADPARQYVAGGSSWVSPVMPIVLPDVADDVMRDFGPAVYEAMAHSDPVLASATAGLAMAIVCGHLELLPAVRPKPKPAKRPAPPAAPGPDGKPAPADPADEEPELTPEEKLSQEVRDYCQRQLDRCKTDVKAWLLQMVLEAIICGHKLAEVVAEYADSGPDGPGEDPRWPAGKLCLVDIKPRPRWAYRFVVNNFMDLLGVLAWDPADMKFKVIEDDKFALMTWLPKDADPRGRSQMRSARVWWHLKRLLPACYYRFLKQHGSPIRFGFTGPDEKGEVPQIDVRTGQELPDAPTITPQQRLTQVLMWLEEGSVCGMPNGTAIQTDWPQGKGDPYLAAFELCDRQMMLAVLHSTRATLEAEHGSKADSQTAQDQTGLVVHYGRGLVRTIVLRPLRPLVEKNFGPDVAARHMPSVQIEADEHQDKAALWTAAAAIFPFLKPSQYDPMYAKLGLPPAAEGEDPMQFLLQTATPRDADGVPIKGGLLDDKARQGEEKG